MTERAEFDFRVKEFADGQPWIMAELLSGPDVLNGKLLGFDLESGTTLDQAKEIAEYMRRHIRGLAVT